MGADSPEKTLTEQTHNPEIQCPVCPCHLGNALVTGGDLREVSVLIDGAMIDDGALTPCAH